MSDRNLLSPSIGFVIFIGFFTLITSQVHAASWRMIVLNNETVPLVMTIKHGNHCFQTNNPGAMNGFITEIPPKGRHEFNFWHANDYRGCAATAGRFLLSFSPSPTVGGVSKDKVGFWFDRGRGFGILYKDYPNYFPGKLTKSDGVVTFTTGANLGSPIVAGKATGDWVAVRTGGTARGKLTMSKSFNVGGSNEKALSTEVRNSISATVESGVSFGPATASVSITGSYESASTEASSIAKTFDNGGEVSCEQEIDTESYDYEVVWQWQVSVSGSSPATIATCSVGCTKTGAKPTFAPGSSQQLQSCKIKRQAQSTAALQGNSGNQYAQASGVVVDFISNYSKVWNDNGSGAQRNVAFWRPEPANGWYRVGHHIAVGYGQPLTATMVVRAKSNGNVLAKPVDFQLIWNDAGSGAAQDGSVWRIICPNGYSALGNVTSGSHQKPAIDEVMCVHQSALAPGRPGSVIWTDVGSGAQLDFGSWNINTSGTAVTRGLFHSAASHSSNSSIQLWAIKP